MNNLSPVRHALLFAFFGACRVFLPVALGLAALSAISAAPALGAGIAGVADADGQTTSDQAKNCVAYDQYGRPYRVACPLPGTSGGEAASSPDTTPTQTPTPTQTTPANPPVANDDSFSAGEAIGLGILALGTGIIANEINNQFFTEQGAPAAPGGSGQTRITIASVKAIETTFGFGGDEIFLLGSNGTRIPSAGAQDIDAGQVWSPNATVTANGGVSFDLREWDSLNASDQIGNFTIAANTAPGRYTATLRGDGAVYEVTYDIAGGQVAGGGGSAPPVSAPQGRRWSASGSAGDIFVADCTDCGEDVGMFFACPSVGQPAIVAVPWLATENGPAGMVLPLEMTIGNQRFVYDATLSQPGLVGHVPQFQMNPNDPALEALMAGNSASIVFDGNQANIGLSGSRAALTTFKAQCGWNGIPVGMQSNQGQSMPAGVDMPASAPQDLVWFASAYQDDQVGGTVGTLTYGIPETDAITFSATCQPGRNPNANVSFNVGLRTLQLGEQATLYIQPEGVNYQYAGSTYSVGGGEFEGVETQIALTDPVWQAMMRAQNTFLFGAYGGGEGAAQPVGISSAISQFLQTCQAGSGQMQNQTQGQTQQQQDVFFNQGQGQGQTQGQTQQQGVFGNQNQTQQQQQQQDLFFSQGQGQGQPQQQQGVFGNQTQGQTQQQQNQFPAPQQGIMIDGTYACNDNSTVQIASSTLGATELVNLVRNGTDVYALSRQPSQTGSATYAGSGITLTPGAGIVQLSGGGVTLLCQKR